MPSQSQVQDTIVNGSYRLSGLVNTNLNLVLGGGLAVKENFINWFNLNLQGLIYQYNAQDYISNTTLTLYDRINWFIGIPANATIDPNFQNPSFVIDNTIIPPSNFDINKTQADLVDASGGNWYLPLLDESGNPLVNGAIPVSVTLNGESFTFTYSKNFTPPRIYGFASNDAPQAIIVTLVIAT